MRLRSRAFRATIAVCTTLALWASAALVTSSESARLARAQEPSAAPAILPEVVTPEIVPEAAPLSEAATFEPLEKITLIIPLFTATSTPTRTPSPVNIGNFIWDDFDSDGRQDAGEPGLSGVVVQLWNSAKTQILDQTVTGVDGIYTLVAPQPMNVRVRVVLPSGSDQFSPKDQAGGDNTLDSDINVSGISVGFTDIIAIASNVISITSIDAGIVKFRTPTPTRTPTPVNLGNFVWDDLDGDGRQDAGEPGLSGVVVQLWNSAKNQLLDQTVTNASGSYTLQSDGPGQFRVRVVLPSGGDQFSPKDQAGGDDSDDSDINPSGTDAGFTDIINIASNVISITSIDAGLRPFKTPTPTRTPTPVSIGNFVWHDLDGDGQQDPGEPGVAGVVVQLWSSDKTQLIDQKVTNASGNFFLVSPGPGQFRVRVLIPPGSGASFSPKNQASGNDQLDSDINTSYLTFNRGFTDVIDIASNVISTTLHDAGLINVGPFAPPTLTTVPTATEPLEDDPTATPTSTSTATPEGFVAYEPLVYVPWAER